MSWKEYHTARVGTHAVYYKKNKLVRIYCKKCRKNIKEKYHWQKKHALGWKNYNTTFKQEYQVLYHRQRQQACSKAGKIGGKNSQKEQQKHPKKYHQNHVKIGKIGGHNAQKTLKKEEKGLYGMTHLQHIKSGQKSQREQRKNLVKYLSDRSKGGKKGGPASQISIRKNKPYWFLQTPFASSQENHAAKVFFFNYLFVPDEGKSCHIRVDGGELDFKLFDFIFCEYHPFRNNRDRHNITFTRYYKQRRRLLDENGFTNNPLIVFKNLKEVEKFARRI